eukprot:TRINITY_DN2527_c0_g1_i1.p1 TRINITY_DN2527_c0_g1~~TRINITY_DN2527_c0_g1_i1.p1  ORF type:complete len:704 (+),score=156.80 TRINITY_DN2527_c0_g1_i1:236-2113(+)
MEMDTDRPGRAYKEFAMTDPDARLCQAECDREVQCQTWVYVKPGIKGPSPMCQLKRQEALPEKNECCVSGTSEMYKSKYLGRPFNLWADVVDQLRDFRNDTSWNNTIDRSLDKLVKTYGGEWDPVLPFKEFRATMEEFASVMSHVLMNTDLWLGDGFREVLTAQTFFPYVEKFYVPIGSHIVIFGDLHGSIHTLIAGLRYLRDERAVLFDDWLLRRDYYIVFLGDNVDRGLYGTEVLYTLMRLKVANPDNVYLLRGMHEDCDINEDCSFKKEAFAKYGGASGFEFRKFCQLWDFLPVSLYIGTSAQKPLPPCVPHRQQGCKPEGFVPKEKPPEPPPCINFVQYVHAAMEIGYNPKLFLTAPDPIRFERIVEVRREPWMKDLELPTPKTCCEANKAWYGCLLSLFHELEELPPHENPLVNFYPRTPSYPFRLGFQYGNFLFDTPCGNESKGEESKGEKSKGEKSKGEESKGDTQTENTPPCPLQFFRECHHDRIWIGKEVALRLMEEATTPHQACLRAVFRGHQHTNPKTCRRKVEARMLDQLEKQKGLVCLWGATGPGGPRDGSSLMYEGEVCTLFNAPEAGLPQQCGKAFDWDSIAIMTVREQFDLYALEHHVKHFQEQQWGLG